LGRGVSLARKFYEEYMVQEWLRMRPQLTGGGLVRSNRAGMF